MSIQVAPVNRNAPQFNPNQMFSTEIPESQSVGASVGRVTASDADGGNAFVTVLTLTELYLWQIQIKY